MTDEMREPTFLALAALADGRKHGYGIIQEVDRLSNGRTRLRAGTLYAMLDRLAHDGARSQPGDQVVRRAETYRYAYIQPVVPSQVCHRCDQIHGSMVASEAPSG